MRMASRRWVAAGMALSLCVMMVLAEDVASSGDSAEDVASGDEDKHQITYDPVAGFVLQSHATIQKGRSQRGCELICSRAPTCKSYSYRETDRTCVVSQDSLTYDPEFTFNAKSEPGDKVPYHTFEGLTYRAVGWMKSVGHSKDECAHLCSQAATCKAFSYRERDEMCLLSAKGIAYSAEFTYYEKNKVRNQNKSPPVSPIPGALNPDAFKPPAKPADVPPTQNPQLIHLEEKEKMAAKQATEANAAASHHESKSKADVAKMKLEAKAGVAEAEAADKKKLADMMAEYTAHSNEIMAKEQNKAKINFAHHELKMKVGQKSIALEQTRERSQKSLDKIRAMGQATASRAKNEAERAADMEMKKMALAGELKDTQRQINRAAVNEAAAKKEEEKESVIGKHVQEREAKEDGAEKSESSQKTAITTAKIELRTKSTSREAQQDTVKIKEKNIKEVAESKQKEDIRHTERGVKSVDMADYKEKQAKRSAADVIEIREKGSAATKRSEDKLKQAQDETAAAIRQKDISVEHNRLLKKQIKVKVQGELYSTRISQKGAEITQKDQNTQKLTQLKLSLQKRFEDVQSIANQQAKAVKDRDMQVAMLRTEPERNATLEQYQATRKQYDDIKEAWNAHKDDILANRSLTKDDLYGELATAKTDAQTELQHAKALAKEKVSKAKQEAEHTIAKGVANGRLAIAKADEESVKIKQKRVQWEKDTHGIVPLTIKSDIAAFVDSGPNREGTNSPELRTAMIKAQFKKKQANMIKAEEEKEYIAAELRYKSDVSAANTSLTEGNERNSKFFDGIANSTQGAIAGLNASLSTMSDISTLQSSMLGLQSNSYAANVSMPDISGFTKEELGEQMEAARQLTPSVTLLEDDEFEDADETSAFKDPSFSGRRLLQSPTSAPTTSSPTSFGDTSSPTSATPATTSPSPTDAPSASGTTAPTVPTGNLSTPTAVPTGNLSTPTAVPTGNLSTPTAVPTANTTTSPVAELQEKANEIHEQAQKYHEMDTERNFQTNRYNAAERAFKSQESFLANNYQWKLGRLNNTLNSAAQEREDAAEQYNNASGTFDDAEAAYNAVMLLDSNKPFGDVNSVGSGLVGFLRLQQAQNRDQEAFIKFPSNLIRAHDTITAAKLKLYKNGGTGGPVSVSAVSCSWTRGTLTYTKTLTMAMERVSVGLDNIIPNANEDWFEIGLRADVLQNNRLNGDHLCLQVRGGPADTNADISSELTDWPPTLELEVREVGQHLKYAGAYPARPIQKKEPKDKSQQCRDRIKAELIERYTNLQLKVNKRNAKTEEQRLQANFASNSNANDVLQVLNMQTDSTLMAQQQLAAQAAGIQQYAQGQIENELLGMANSGMTQEQMAQATAAMQAGLANDVSLQTSQAATQISANAQSSLANAEAGLQQADQANQQQLQQQMKQMQDQSLALTATQTAEVLARASSELVKRLDECAPPKPEFPSVITLPTSPVSSEAVEIGEATAGKVAADRTSLADEEEYSDEEEFGDYSFEELF